MEKSRYTNDKIEKLIKQRQQLDLLIQKEIQLEKSKYKFECKAFLLLIFIIVMPIIAIKVNTKIFPDNSIWSWNYYFKTGFKH